MNIQSLSVVVPNKKCINDCKFCVSKMHAGDEINHLTVGNPQYYLHECDFKRRMEFARDNGCNTVMLTGSSEPQTNKQFLTMFGTVNQSLSRPFHWIEMQTTGVLLNNDYLDFLRSHVGVSTISLSLSSFKSFNNAAYNGTKEDLRIDIQSLCDEIKKHGFILRLSLNLTKDFEACGDATVFSITHSLRADQVTLRKLYEDGSDSPQAVWVRENAASDVFIASLEEYVKQNGKRLERLEYGRVKWSVLGMSVVIDDDCMAKEDNGSYKYLILRPDCHLYSKWDDKGSLIF